jgi:hypothetical protein
MQAYGSEIEPRKEAPMWVDIFRTGSFTTSDGVPKIFTESDLDYMVANCGSTGEVPVSIGPVDHDSPAWAWIRALKREGSVLYADLTEAVPEFLDMVREKKFSKRSISLTAFGNLKGVGFLGADPPRLQSLEALKIASFAVREGVYLQFTENALLQGIAANKLDILIYAKMASDPHLTYSRAFTETQLERPGLAQEYQQELGSRVRNQTIEEESPQPKTTNRSASRIEDLIKKRMTQDTSLTYSEAFSAVQVEHPELVVEYQDSIFERKERTR